MKLEKVGVRRQRSWDEKKIILEFINFRRIQSYYPPNKPDLASVSLRWPQSEEEGLNVSFYMI